MKRNLLVFTLVLFVASVLYTTIGVYIENHCVQAPLVERLNDPSLYPGDPFAEALGRYPSLLWPVVGLLARLVPLEPLLLVLFLIERLFVLYAAGRLARAFAPGSTLAAVAAMAMFGFAIESLLGAGSIVQYYFEQTGLAVAFLLLAIAAFQETRPLAWAIWTAIAFNATCLYGAYALVYFGLVFLLDADYRRHWRQWIPAFGLFLMMSSYALWLALRTLGRPLADKELWLAASYARDWPHLYPKEWTWGPFIQTGFLMALLALLVGLGGIQFRRIRLHALIWSVVAAAWMAIAYHAAYVLVSPSLLLIQPARGTDLWICFASVAILAIASQWVEGGMQSATSAVASRRLGSVLLFASFLVWLPPTWPIAAACLAVLMLPPVWRFLFAGGGPLRLAWLLTFWMCALSLWDFQKGVQKVGLLNALVTRPAPVVRETAAWARAHTPKDSIFLVNIGGDPDWEAFRALSTRSILTNWEEGTAINWSPDFAVPWARRMKLVGYDVRGGPPKRPHALDDMYASLWDDDVRRIRAEVPVRYWVVFDDQPSGFLEVFRCRGQKVLDVEGEIELQ